LVVWGITSATIPFVIFLVLGIFNLDFNVKVGITVVGIIIWCIVLAPFYIMDWDERRRERYRELCKGDALIKLWKVSFDVAEDGSCTLKRLIEGVNLADQRQYYELETWTDPDKDDAHEAFLKSTRKITTDVTVTRKDEPEEKIAVKKTYTPEIAQRINRLIHVIPLTKNGTALKPYEKFTIKYEEKTEKNTLSTNGDYYQHRARHLTERFEVEILLPKNWRFPPEPPPREKLAVGEEKSPTMGEWSTTTEKPQIYQEDGRTRIVWKVDNIKLLHIYKLTYHALERTPKNAT
jgi:hypothetical protein